MFGFAFGNDWNVSAENFGALPLVVGTLITSALALLIGVPVAVATAIYATELCPLRLRAPLTVLVELLAAVPSVVYGLWGIFFLAPKLQPAEQWVADRLSFIPFIGGGTVTIPNYFVTGLVLAIMILPIVSAISREVMATVPADHKEAALGLGATRWEMIRTAVLPYCRAGHRRRGDARPGPRDRRDDRRDDRDRRRAPARQTPVRAGLQPRRGDRQRVRRGPGPAPLGAVRRRARAVRADAARQRRRAGARQQGRAPASASRPQRRHRAAGRSPERRRAHERAEPGRRQLARFAVSPARGAGTGSPAG